VTQEISCGWNCFSRDFRPPPGNDNVPGGLIQMTATHEIALPAIVRALNIYGAVSKHGADRETRLKLARHIVRLCDWGERDPNRLTVHGLTYLRTHDIQHKS
jgi:hypothetical protein